MDMSDGGRQAAGHIGFCDKTSRLARVAMCKVSGIVLGTPSNTKYKGSDDTKANKTPSHDGLKNQISNGFRPLWPIQNYKIWKEDVIYTVFGTTW